MEYYLSIKNKLQLHTATWLNFKCVTVSLKTRYKGYILSDSIKTIYKDREQISDVMDWDCGKELSAKGRSEYFGGRELFYIWIVVVAT